MYLYYGRPFLFLLLAAAGSSVIFSVLIAASLFAPYAPLPYRVVAAFLFVIIASHGAAKIARSSKEA